MLSSLAEALGAGRLNVSRHPELQTLLIGRGIIFSSCISDSQKTVSHTLTYGIPRTKPTGSDANLDAERRKWIMVKAITDQMRRRKLSERWLSARGCTLELPRELIKYKRITSPHPGLKYNM